MPVLHITRGLPGCGKTVLARQMVDGVDPRGSLVRVNRDDLRRMMLPSDYRAPERDLEYTVTRAQHAMIGTLLHSGRDVICDDTNLSARHVRALLEVAVQAGANWSILDMTHVPLEVCIHRDSLREGAEHVGEVVIHRMHSQFIAQHHGKPLPVPDAPFVADRDPYADVEPYTVPVGAARRVVLVDLDGTLALMNGRSPYDETRVEEDEPNIPVIETLAGLVAVGLMPVFLSGRTSGCRAATLNWLRRHVLPAIGWRDNASIELHMRAVGDQRPDHVVKLQMFDDLIRGCYDVAVALDDRDQVVKLWRRLGITCLQVAEGAF